jgi:signal transduction histidine kinase
MPGTGEVAMALRGLGSAGARPAVYVGVETPLSRFQGGQTTDELTVVWLAVTALLVTWLAVLLFVNRFVRRPVAQLSSGVARIAGGDYSSDIPVRSHDELGALARRINRLRAQIEGNIRHVDHAVTRLDEVSRALTTTTTGVGSLESAVCAAAASIAGTGASAWLLERAEDGMRVRASSAGAPAAVELPPAVLGDLLAGRVAGWAEGAHEILAIPMTLRDEVSGALAITAPAAVGDADSRALSALANNAVIALANTRLFEAERETVRRLRELDAMKSDFLATAQHELRTPLTAILGHLELLRILWPTADEAQRLGSIEAVELAARQLSEMLETVIDLSLVSADHLRLQRQAVEVASAVRGALADLERRHPRGLPVEVSVDVPAGLEVDADPERLRQVVRCLVDNAVKFNRPTGRVGVAARADEAGRACVITVSDTGIGIDPSLQERVFERFFQVESGGTRAYGGMGVGLALVKMLAEAHGATVRLASRPGAGTTVELLWPRPGETSGLEGSDRDIDLTGGRPQAAPPRAAGKGTDPGGARPSP